MNNTNPGFDPNGAVGSGSFFASTFTFEAATVDGRTWDSGASNFRTVCSSLRFTRGGLAGWDFPGDPTRSLGIACSTEVRPPY